MKVDKKRMGRIEREVIFRADDGSIVAKETKFRRENGRAGFLVEYLVNGKWTCRSAEASSETVEMVREYRDNRIRTNISAQVSCVSCAAGGACHSPFKD